jgi:hypothetical protein
MKGIPSDEMIAGKNIKRLDAKSDLGKFVLEYAKDENIKRIMARTSKYNLGQLFGMEKKQFKNKIMQAISDIPYQLMSTGKYKNVGFKMLGDIYMFQKHFQQAMYNKLLAQGYSETLPAEQKQTMLDNATDYAAEIAATRTFRAMNIISRSLKNLQNTALKENTPQGRAVYLGLKMLTPFVITPAALVSEAYKFSPLALAKVVAIDIGLGNITGKWKKADSSVKVATMQKLSQAMVGTSMQFAVGMILSAFGMLTGALPEDEDERKQWEAEGKKPYSIYIPGVGYIPIDWAQPVSTGIMIGANTLQTLLKADTSLLEKVGAPFTSSLNVIVKNSLLQNIFQQFGGNYQDNTFAGIAAEFAKNGIFQGMPAIIKKFNKILDPYERNVYSGSALQQLLNRFLQSVPAGSFFIPKKIDVWGREITSVKSTGAFGVAGRFFNSLILPFTFSPDKMDSVSKEVTRVFNETKDPAALPSIANKTIVRTKNGVKTTWDLTAKEYIEYQQDIGKRSRAEVERLISGSTYKNMSEKNKAESLAKIYSESVKKAGDAFVKENPK